MSLDVMDEAEQHVTGYEHDVFKVRLDPSGNEIQKDKPKELSNSLQGAAIAMKNQEDNYCGPCYGASPDSNHCCNTCEEVQQLYSEQGWAFNPDSIEQCVREGWREKMESQSKEGCNMHGHLLVNKVRGNFHFSPGKAVAHGSSHVHDIRTYLLENHDFSHKIHHLQFGNQDNQAHKQKRTQMNSLTNPLDNTVQDKPNPALMYQYYLKIVPTRFDYVNGHTLDTFQYSVSQQERDLRQQATGGLPGVFFVMDFSPMLVIYSESRQSLSSFLTSVCAIVGGIFTVASIVDGALYRAERSLKKKSEFGKVH
ncbi:hypothetical protein DFQ29_003201 [Apophysomyces sp. BC1021]|nr:hypothetical protein DFQ29_003201 [Apophysomyces sp. BC1021]